MNKTVRLSLLFDNGTEVSCVSRAGFSSLFDVALAIRNAHAEMESLRVRFGDELVEKEKQANR